MSPALTSSPFQQSCLRFVDRMTALCASDRAAQAALRSGLGKPLTGAKRMHRYVVPWMRDGLRPAEQQAFYTVASLIAARPRTARADDGADHAPEAEPAETSPETDAQGRAARPASLGTTLGSAVRAGRMKEDTGAAHLHRLGRQDIDTVRARLPALVAYAASAQAEPDFAVLLADLRRWEQFRDQISTRWLQDFYRALTPESPTEPDPEESVESENL